MSDIVVRTENVGKLYRIGERKGNYKTLRETIAKTFSSPLRQLVSKPQASTLKPQPDFIWALKDISFEVKRGEVVGIIGHNGAGKTTLLRILSRITEPTKGWAEIHGRVGSLLEVGTGFHPELTGRENIYLNGAILGMKKAEINRKFDEIVAFAEVEKFIDTPVKRYSSGMYVRLAFAVAAHLEPEILLVDEVLAVGDAAFQKKCIGKMGEAAKEGRTVLFVSHNMAAILGLCQRTILLESGTVSHDGSVREIVETYLNSGSSGAAEVVWQLGKAPGNHIAKLRGIRIRDAGGKVSTDHQVSKPIRVEVEFWCLKPNMRLTPGFLIHNSLDICVFASGDFLPGAEKENAMYQPGLYRASAVIPGGLLNDGTYHVTPVVLKDLSEWVAAQNRAATLQVHDDGYGRGAYTSGWIGVVRPLLSWDVEGVGDV
jgi:lipopolysaccharide transport system ATP-binding protein